MLKIRLCGLVAVLFLFLGCSASKGREITDPSGKIVTIKGEINRIISTAPSNTEIIVDLGLAYKLVAIDRHSTDIYVPAGYPEIPEGLPLLDFFYPDAEVIISLKPDLIIASGHNPTGTGEDPFKVLRDMGIPVVYISMSKSIEDIYRNITFIADLLQVQTTGEELISLMNEQVLEIAQAAHAAHGGVPVSVYFEISAAPDMMTFGKDSFIDDMISIIGAENIFGNENWLVMPGAESIIERNPDIILTNVNYIDDPISEIKSRLGFNHINAVANNRIYQIDTNSSVRDASRIVLALRQMAEKKNEKEAQ
jgi:iron complex transport system substrate-binding protein